MLGHLESMTQLLQEERDFYKRECELLRNMKEKSALMSPPTRERVMNYSMSFGKCERRAITIPPFFIVSICFLMLIPFSLSWKNFLTFYKREMLTDRPCVWLAFAVLQTPFFKPFVACSQTLYFFLAPSVSMKIRAHFHALRLLSPARRIRRKKKPSEYFVVMLVNYFTRSC